MSTRRVSQANRRIRRNVTPIQRATISPAPTVTMRAVQDSLRRVWTSATRTSGIVARRAEPAGIVTTRRRTAAAVSTGGVSPRLSSLHRRTAPATISVAVARVPRPGSMMRRGTTIASAVRISTGSQRSSSRARCTVAAAARTPPSSRSRSSGSAMASSTTKLRGRSSMAPSRHHPRPLDARVQSDSAMTGKARSISVGEG